MPRKAAAPPAPSTRTTRSKSATTASTSAVVDGVTASDSKSGDKRPLDTRDEEQDPQPVAKKPRGRPKKVTKAEPDAAEKDAEVKNVAEKDDDKPNDAPIAPAQDGKVEDVKPTKPAAKGKGKKGAKTVTEHSKEDADEAVKATTSGTKDEDVKAEDKPEDKPVKIKTIIKRGKAPVDPESSYVNTHQVYVDPSGEVYDGMLMQTNIGVNANKFYALQLLHPVGSDAVILHTRWGRVGERGAAQDKGPWTPAMAVMEFKKQFRSKTGFAWEARRSQKAKPGKYDFVERDFEADEDEEDKPGKSGTSKSKEVAKIPDSKLPPPLQDLMKLIFNTSYMNAMLSSFSYDQNKAPLGKMSKATLLKGFAELKKISEAINNPSSPAVLERGGLRAACAAYSNQYYTYIPHVFGRNPPVIIDNQALLQRELDLIDALGDMEVASKLLTDSIHQTEDGTPIHPLDAQLASLDLKYIAPLNKQDPEFEAIARYARDTHGSTHHFGAEVLDIFRVERKGEREAWQAAGWHTLPHGDRMLLWHGSRATNFGGILKQGLRIAPPEAPVSGYMFGKGVYFADMMSKSAGYCHSYLSGQTGLLLLCEVAAKPFLELTHADYNAGEKCLGAKALATKGLGRTAPTKWIDAGRNTGWDELQGTLMPAGPGEPVNLQNASLMYNEYIVYQPHQIKLRYLLRCKLA